MGAQQPLIFLQAIRRAGKHRKKVWKLQNRGVLFTGSIELKYVPEGSVSSFPSNIISDRKS